MENVAWAAPKGLFCPAGKIKKPMFCRGPGSPSSLQGGGRTPKTWMSSWSSHMDAVPLLQVAEMMLQAPPDGTGEEEFSPNLA